MHFGNPLPHADDLTPQQWGDMAREAFLMGFKDGGELSGPVDRHKVWAAIGAKYGRGQRKLHTDKLRQVYGAGFDIAAMHKRLAAEKQR